MDVPDLVREALEDEEVTAGVSLGDEDAVCFTPTRTLVYRGEGLLSDEAVATYPHDFERLAVKEGRRKTKFVLTYVDHEDSFGVPGSRADALLERLLEGHLRAASAIAENESVTGVFRFSELTIVVAQGRLLKHVGGYTWAADFEAYPFDEVTGLAFEEGSVATSVVLETEGRPERFKAPNDEAHHLKSALKKVLFAYHDVDSLEALNEKLGGDGEVDDDRGDIDLEAGIDPLVGGEDDAGGDEDPAVEPGGETAGDSSPDPADAEEGGGEATATFEFPDDEEDTGAGEPSTEAPATTDADLEAMEAKLDELTAAVSKQNDILERQQQTIKQLIEELRQGR